MQSGGTLYFTTIFCTWARTPLVLLASLDAWVLVVWIEPSAGTGFLSGSIITRTKQNSLSQTLMGMIAEPHAIIADIISILFKKFYGNERVKVESRDTSLNDLCSPGQFIIF